MVKAEELLESSNSLSSSNAYSVAIKAGWSHKDANKLQNDLLLAGMKK